MADYQGPHVQTACFCEKIIRGAQSGALSVINIIDGVGVTGTDPDEMPGFSLENLVVVINLWAGLTRGRYSLRLRPEAPSGHQGDVIDLGTLNFAGDASAGIDTITTMPPFEVTEEGTYWFDVLIHSSQVQEDRLLTRMRLNVTYQPQPQR
jgi:hypothetical protein